MFPQHFAEFERKRYPPVFTAFTNHREQEVVKVYILGPKSESFLDTQTSIEQRADKGVKSLLCAAHRLTTGDFMNLVSRERRQRFGWLFEPSDGEAKFGPLRICVEDADAVVARRSFQASLTHRNHTVFETRLSERVFF